MNLINKNKVVFKYFNQFKKITGLGKVHGKFLRVRSNDFYLVSYPKSGNTWLRFLIANYLFDELVNFKTIEELIPDIYKKHASYFDEKEGLRIIKSHEPYNKLYAKVIYIVRDPRDVLISYYNYHKKFYKFKGNIDEYFNAFIKGKNSPYGNWKDHVSGWYNASIHNSNIHMVRYEDLKKDTKSTLIDIFIFMNIEIDEIKLNQAIEKSSFNEMKEIENKGNSDGMLAGSDTNLSFIRSGGGEWNKFFSEKEEALLIRSFNQIMNKLGYI